MIFLLCVGKRLTEQLADMPQFVSMNGGRDFVINCKELSDDLTEKQRKEKIKQIQDGNFQILLATGQLIGEGTDFNNSDCLFLVFPFAFQGKLTQYIGRIQRGNGKEGKVYDYRDMRIDYLNHLFKKRLKYLSEEF